MERIQSEILASSKLKGALGGEVSDFCWEMCRDTKASFHFRDLMEILMIIAVTWLLPELLPQVSTLVAHLKRSGVPA